MCPATVKNLIKDYVKKGIDYIIRYNISPNSATVLRKAGGRTEAELIQIACAPAPDGHSRWTIRLLEEKARIELETSVSKETIRRVLKKRTSISQKRLLVHRSKRKRRIRSLHGGYS